MRERIEDICSKQLSYLIAEYSKLHVSNITHICFDSSFLTKTLEKNGVNDTTLITIKTNLRAYKHFNQIFHILIKDENLIISLVFLISSIMLILTYFYSNKFIEFISPILAKYGDITVDEALTYHRVKDYLFYNNDSPMKGININEAENMANELLKTDRKLTALVYECRKYFISLKLSITSNAICIVLLIATILTFCLLLHSLRVELGVFRAISTLISIIFIIIVSVICFKIILKSEHFDEKKESENEPIKK
jgi:hypothetical protein